MHAENAAQSRAIVGLSQIATGATSLYEASPVVTSMSIFTPCVLIKYLVEIQRVRAFEP